MKISKTFLSGLLAVGVASAASAAPTYVRIVGSTAYRAPVTQAIIDYLTAQNTGTPSTAYWGSSSTALLKAPGAIFSGTVGTTQIVVETYWTGSVAGLVDVTLQNQLPGFLNYTSVSSSMTTAAASVNLGSTPAFDTTNPTPNAAMSDSYYQSVAKVLSSANVPVNVTGSTGAQLAAAINSTTYTNAGTSGNAATAKTVGVIPFVWVLGNPGTSNLTAANISQQVAKALLTNGSVNFSQVSGNASDVTNFALLVGRNEDSGTRVDSAAEAQAGFGISPVQALVGFNSNNTSDSSVPPVLSDNGLYTGGKGSSIASLTAWTAGAALNTESGISWSAAGHGGYVTGGDVANVLLAQNNGGFTVDASIAPASVDYTDGTSKIALIGYLGMADAYGDFQGNTGGNAIQLTYNGVACTPTNIENGSYTLWGYEHMYYTSASASTTMVKNVLNGIADKVYNVDANIDSSGLTGQNDAAGIKISAMSVSRSLSEGATVTSPAPLD